MRFTCFHMCLDSATDLIETPGHNVCGEPPHPELPSHHSGPVQLPAASKDRRSVLVQDDPHPGLHRLPAHHEQPAAYNRKHHTSLKSVDKLFIRIMQLGQLIF